MAHEGRPGFPPGPEAHPGHQRSRCSRDGGLRVRRRLEPWITRRPNHRMTRIETYNTSLALHRSFSACRPPQTTWKAAHAHPSVGTSRLVLVTSSTVRMISCAPASQPPSTAERRSEPWRAGRPPAAAAAPAHGHVRSVLAAQRRHRSWVAPMREYNEDPAFLVITAPETFAARRRRFTSPSTNARRLVWLPPRRVSRTALGRTSQGGVFEARRSSKAAAGNVGRGQQA